MAHRLDGGLGRMEVDRKLGRVKTHFGTEIGRSPCQVE